MSRKYSYWKRKKGKRIVTVRAYTNKNGTRVIQERTKKGWVTTQYKYSRSRFIEWTSSIRYRASSTIGVWEEDLTIDLKTKNAQDTRIILKRKAQELFNQDDFYEAVEILAHKIIIVKGVPSEWKDTIKRGEEVLI